MKVHKVRMSGENFSGARAEAGFAALLAAGVTYENVSVDWDDRRKEGHADCSITGVSAFVELRFETLDELRGWFFVAPIVGRNSDGESSRLYHVLHDALKGTNYANR